MICLNFESLVSSLARVFNGVFSKGTRNAYAAGTTKSVKSVDTVIPPITAMAIGIRVSAPGPTANAGGMAAAIVETEVMMIGLKRMGQADFKASMGLMPCSLF